MFKGTSGGFRGVSGGFMGFSRAFCVSEGVQEIQGRFHELSRGFQGYSRVFHAFSEGSIGIQGVLDSFQVRQ